MDSAAGIGVFPLDGSGSLVVLKDVAHELASEVCGGLEDAAGDDLALELGKPELDLVEPTGIRRGEVKMHIGMAAEEVPDPLGLVSRQVVGDDVDLLVGGVLGDQSAEESDELLTAFAMAPSRSTRPSTLEPARSRGELSPGIPGCFQ